MSTATGPLLGVLGGMGPLATAHFYRCLVERTPAIADQEHVPVVIWADPNVPDRTNALVGRGESPLPALLHGVRQLQSVGATAIAVPCNTAHAWVPTLRRTTGADFVEMPLAAIEDAMRLAPLTRRVGLIATRGTRLAKIYEAAASRRHVTICHLSEGAQRTLVDPAIAAVKSGGDLTEAVAAIAAAARDLAEEGAEVVIAGCTEIPVVASGAREFVAVVDSTVSLADAALDEMRRQSTAAAACGAPFV